MFISNSKRTKLINLDRVDGVKLENKNENESDIVICNYEMVSVGTRLIESTKIIGRYSKTQAQQIIGEIYQSMEQGKSVYVLPEINNA